MSIITIELSGPMAHLLVKIIEEINRLQRDEIPLAEMLERQRILDQVEMGFSEIQEEEDNDCKNT